VKFGASEYFWLLWVVVAALLFQIYVARTKHRLLARFAAPGLLERITGSVSRPRQRLKVALLLLGLLFGVLSLVQAKWGFHWEEVQRRGVDVVVALDVSDSMLARDAESGGDLPRLERAKREITDLLNLMDGDRVGLVAFAGAAFLECPLTLDYSAAALFLEDIDTELIPIKGTAIAEALRTSIGAFEGGAADSRAVILITDGEDHSGEALAAAEEAKQQGVRIFAIGIGKPEGAPIPEAGGGFKKTRSGEMVLSKLDETTLQKIALTTGGKYVRSVTGDLDLESIYLDGVKASLEERELESSRRKRWEHRFQWILALALLALALEPLLPERRGRSRHA